MRRFSVPVLVLVLAWCLAASAVLAQPPAAPPPPSGDGEGAVRRQVSDARVLSTSVTCFYGPNLDRGQARRLCFHQGRARLLDAAASQLAGEPALAGANLGRGDLRAFVDSLLEPGVADEEVRQVPDGLAVRLTLRAEVSPGRLAERLAVFAGDPKIRAAALAGTATRDRLAAEARMAAVPFGADREFRAREMENAMREDAAFAERRIAPGMSMADVKELLGNPATVKQSVIGADTYVCAGYGQVFVVYRDGQVACLRSRLDYVRRYDTDCHCAGDYSSILKAD